MANPVPRPPIRDHRAPVTAIPKRTTSKDVTTNVTNAESSVTNPVTVQTIPAIPNPPETVTFTEPGQKPETEFATPKRTGLIVLPSGGRFYGSALPDGAVEVYTMTAVEDKILSELTNDNSLEIFDAILARCVKSPIAIEELLDTDRYYLLLVLRSVSLGDDYTFPNECPFCNTVNMHTVAVPGSFPIVKGTAQQEPFFVTLPGGASLGGTVVGMRFLRDKDLREINDYRRRNTSMDTTKGDPAYAYANAKVIVSVNGKAFPDMLSAMDWYMQLPLKSVRALRKAAAAASSGVSNMVKIKCPNKGCSKESVTAVPLSPMYFFE